MRFLPPQPATNPDGLTPEEQRLKESQLAYAKKKAEREEKERVIREEEEKQRKIKQLEMWNEQKRQAKLAKIEREKELRSREYYYTLYLVNYVNCIYEVVMFNNVHIMCSLLYYCFILYYTQNTKQN